MNEFIAYENQLSLISIKLSRKSQYFSEEFLSDISIVIGELKVLSKNGFSKLGIVDQLERIQILIDKFKKTRRLI